MEHRRLDKWLAAVVLAHLLVTFMHGAAHRGANVGLDVAGMLFVIVVIEIGPVAGLVISTFRPVLGGWTVAASMFGALLFGFVNHFVIVSPDHVSRVAAEWQPLFGVSAALLVVTELAGVVAGWRSAMRPREVRP